MRAAESIAGGLVPPETPARKATPDPDAVLIGQIRAGSETAFSELVQRHHSGMIRMACSYVPPSLAEEVAQETWISVLKGLSRFEGRSSFKTWLFRVLINRALTHAAHEARAGRVKNDPMSEKSEEELIEAWHFYADDHARAGMWLVPPRAWSPEEKLLSAETLQRIEQEIEKLPLLQRQVITLRDVEGWTSREVCELCGITETHQRVLLHRARTRLRNALDQIFFREEP